MKKRILIIDDEPSICELLVQYLTIKGFEAASVSTAHDALQKVKEQAPDLMVVDLTLADSDGLVLVDSLRKLAPGVPVILLTGVHFEGDVVQRKIRDFVDAYVHKAEPLERVVEVIRGLLAAKKA